MFLRSKVQEMILKRRSKSMNNGAGAQQRSHTSDQLVCASTIPCDNACSGGSKSAAARALFASPRLLHSSSLPAGGKSCSAPGAESPEPAAFSMSPTSVIDAAEAFASGSDAVVGKRRPWREGLHGLADALDCTDERHDASPSLVRSCSLDRRVEFGVKNKSSWLPLCGGSGRDAATSPGAGAAASGGVEPGEVMEPSSEDYTCVICRGPNPRTVHIFGDRVVEGAAEDSSPRPINLPARGEGVVLSL